MNSLVTLSPSALMVILYQFVLPDWCAKASNYYFLLIFCQLWQIFVKTHVHNILTGPCKKCVKAFRAALCSLVYKAIEQRKVTLEMLCATAFSAGALLWVVERLTSGTCSTSQVPEVHFRKFLFLKLGLATYLNALSCFIKVPFPLISQEELGNRALNVGTVGRKNSPAGTSGASHFLLKKNHKTSQHPLSLSYSGPAVNVWSWQLLCSDFQRFLDCWEGWVLLLLLEL